MFIKSFVETQPCHLFTYVLSIADFVLQWQSRVVAIETAGLAMLKILMLWPFMEKVCQPLYCMINSEIRDLPDITKHGVQEWVALKHGCLMGNQNKRSF